MKFAGPLVEHLKQACRLCTLWLLCRYSPGSSQGLLRLSGLGDHSDMWGNCQGWEVFLGRFLVGSISHYQKLSLGRLLGMYMVSWKISLLNLFSGANIIQIYFGISDGCVHVISKLPIDSLKSVLEQIKKIIWSLSTGHNLGGREEKVSCLMLGMITCYFIGDGMGTFPVISYQVLLAVHLPKTRPPFWHRHPNFAKD